jgi:hypothetical protein
MDGLSNVAHAIQELFFKIIEHSMCIRAVIAQSVYRLGYGLDDRGSRARFPAGAGNFFSSPPRP